MGQTLILINGPSGAGKTTITRELWKTLPRTAKIHLDEIKWQISDYNDKDVGPASEVGERMANEYLKHDLNVIVDKAFCKEEHIEPFRLLGRKRDVKTRTYNIEAPWDVLAKRVESRGQQTTLEKSKKSHKNYEENKFSVDKTFDTSKKDVQQVVEEIKKDIDT